MKKVSELGGCHTIENITRGAVLADRARIADTFFTRAFGLLGRSGLGAGEGIVLKPCSSVHTTFMRFSIDVLFVGTGGRVVGIVHRLGPWRTARIKGARLVVELPAGMIESSGTQEGDVLTIMPGD